MWCHLTSIWPRAKSKVHQGQIKVNVKLVQDFDVESIRVKLYHNVCNSCYYIHKAAWPRFRLKVQKGRTKINVKLLHDFNGENISVELQYDADNFLRVIVFTGYCYLPSISSGSEVQKSQIKVNVKLFQSFDAENIPVKLQHNTCNFWGIIAFTGKLDLELVWKSKKVTQRSSFFFNINWLHTKINFILLWDCGCREYPYKVTPWCMQFLKSHCVPKTIRFAPLARARVKVQQGHTNVNIKLGWNVDVENIALYKVTQHGAGKLRGVIRRCCTKVTQRSVLNSCKYWCGEHPCQVTTW